MPLRLLHKVLDNWPLKRQLGFYAYLPIFFAAGAALEFTMIHMRINNVDFYSVYMEKERVRLEEEARRLSQRLEERKVAYEKKFAPATTNEPPKS